MKRVLPGVALAAVVMLVSLPLADVLGRAVLSFQGIDPTGKASPVSGVLVAIIIGLVIRNAISLPAVFTDGIRFSVTRLLRLGIIFIGIKLSFLDVLKLGGWGIPVVATSIVSGLV